MSCEVFNIDNPIFRVEYNFIDTKKKEIYYYVGEQREKIKKILNKIENEELLNKKDKIEIKKEFKKDYKKMNYYIKKKTKIKYIYDIIKLTDNVIKIKEKIFMYIHETYLKLNKKKYINLNNQLLWLEDDIILGNNYNNNKIIPKNITKIKLDDKFINKDDERISRDDVISNNNEILYDILNKNNLSKDSYKISLINANDILEFLKKKKKLNDKYINGYIYKYFPKYIKIDNQKCDNKFLNLKQKINKQKLLDNINVENKDIISDYCSLTTIKIKTNLSKIFKKYDTEDININLDNIFYYITQKSKLFGKEIPFIKINNYKNERYILISPIIKNLVDSKKLKSWTGLIKEKDRIEIKGNIVHILFKKLYKIIDYKNEETNTIEKIPLYYTISILKQGNIVLNISFSKLYKLKIENIIELTKDLNKLLTKINNPSNVKLSNLDNFKLEKLEIDYKNKRIIKGEYTDIDYFNMSIMNKEELNLFEFGKFLVYFNNNIKLKSLLSKDITNLKFKYIKVSNYLDIYDIIKDIKILIQNGMSEQQVIAHLIKNSYISKSKAIDIMKFWKKIFDKDVYKNNLFNEGVSINIINNKIELRGLKNLFQFGNIYILINKLIYIFKNYDTFKSNKDFKKYYLKDDKKNNEEINYNTNDLYNVNNNNYEINNNYNNYNDFNNKNINDLEIYNNNDENSTEKKLDKIINDYTNQIEIHPSLRLEAVCKDGEVDDDLQTCKDLCNDNRYFLRRLQTFNPYLFRNTILKKGKNLYSKSCQRKSQPVILSKDPNQIFKKESFDTSLKYNTNNKDFYYICPDTWCPKCELPFSIKEIGGEDKIMKKKGINGACFVAICPNSTEKEPHELFVRIDQDAFNSYPGFSKIKNPDGYCYPCCFKKNPNNPLSSKYKNFKECLGEEIVDIKNKNSNIYILDYKMPLNQSRFGLLPNTLLRIFGNCEKGYIQNNKCFVKRGVANNFNKSFLYCIADIMSPDKFNLLSINKIINNIISNKNFNDKLFKSLNGGMLEYRFNTSKKNLLLIILKILLNLIVVLIMNIYGIYYKDLVFYLKKVVILLLLKNLK